MLWEGKGGISISKRSALCKHNHLLPVIRQWQDQHQQEGLHFASTITYTLQEGNGRISISKGSALGKHNHLQPVKRRWQDQHQQGFCTLQAQ
jgi:hypothetical protein